MSAQKITDEQWAEARKRYETEPGLGLGKLAQVLDCSKSLVARKAREGKWQKDQTVPVQVHAGARAREAKFTESSVLGETQAVHVYDPKPQNQVARAADGVFVPPTASAAPPDDETMPEDLSDAEREDWVKRAIIRRQMALNRRFELEAKNVRARLYAAIKNFDKEGGNSAALGVLRLTQALSQLQAQEADIELERAKLEYGLWAGRPKEQEPVRVVVHIREGESLLGGASVFGPNAAEIIDVVAKETNRD